jgi:hypothetical protein
MTTRTALLGAIFLAAALPADAQSPDHGWVDVNAVSVQAAQGTQSYVYNQTISLEQAAFASAYPKMPTAHTVEINGGVRLGGAIAMGVYLGGVNSEYKVGLGATVPHPLLFNHSATAASTTATTLQRHDRSLDISVVYLPPLANKNVSLRFFGGPTYFTVSQDMVSDIGYEQTYNLFGVNIVNITTFQQKAVDSTAWGVHGGFDFGYFLTRYIGIGGGLRVNAGSASVEDPLSLTAAKLKLGHVTAGGGLRLRF